MPENLSAEQIAKEKKIQYYEEVRKSDFKQQIFNVYKPKLTVKSVVKYFFGIGIICIIIGSQIISNSNAVVEVATRYDETCYDKLHLPSTSSDVNSEAYQKTLCDVEIEISKDIPGPVYVFYQLKEFYQNHRTYVKSRSYKQSRGNYIAPELLSDCEPIILVSDMHKYQKTSVSGKKLEDDWPAIPCGLIAKSYFNDSFWLFQKEDGKADKELLIDDKKIAWDSDVEHKFKNIKEDTIPDDDALKGKTWKDLQWIDMTDQHFMVWMRTASLPNFRKLYGSLADGLKAGKYTLKVANNFNVKTFNGEKSFVLATTSSQGGKNDFLGIAFLVVGVGSILYGIGFIVVFKKKRTA